MSSQPLSTAAGFSLRDLRHQTGTLEQAAARLAGLVLEAESAHPPGGTSLIIPVNGQVFVLAHQQTAFADVLRGAEEIVLDGISVWGASRLLGRSDAQRHQGVDLMYALCRHLNGSPARVLLLGGKPGAAKRTRDFLEQTLCPDLRIEACCPPMHFETLPEQLARVEQVIRDFKPSLVCVALGAPRQEFFMNTYLRAWNVPVAMAVGGTFEMLGGMIPRAPRYVRTLGMEWFFRMMLEPRRLAKRYLYTNTIFLWVLLRELLQQTPDLPIETNHAGKLKETSKD